ncbi:MAG: CDP-glycerol glycerophosphotransferase family protein [Luteolibacter sp.]
MIKLIRKLIELVHGKLPKQNHAVIYGWPNYEDNTLAFEAALCNSDLDQVIILVSGHPPQTPQGFGNKTIQIRKNSFMGLWLFLRAKYVFFTHPCFVRDFPDDVVSVNVWHGMPIKRIGRMLERQMDIPSSHALATSPFWKDIMQQSMPPKKEILITGLPRNDFLFTQKSSVSNLLELENSERLVAWLPTYRRSVRGELREDGTDYENIFEMPDVDPVCLNRNLKELNSILWIKPHPMAPSLSAREWSNIRIVDEKSLRQEGLSLYQLLSASELLITDISSVLIDFLLTDKPVIHAFPDIEQYKSSRGFSVEPIEDYFAGEVVSNQDELLKALEVELSGKDPHAEKRRALRDLSHTHQDNKSTERLLKAVGL